MCSVCCLVYGCHSPQSVSPLAIGDSAGVIIVDVDRDQTPLIDAIDSDASWIVDAVDGQPLFGVADAVYGADGTLLIAEASTQEIARVVLRTGETRRWGGIGDGPMEFRGLARVLRLPGGRIGAFDRVRLRVVEIDLDHGMVGERTLPTVAPAGSTVNLIVPDSGPMFITAITNFAADGRSGIYRGSSPLVRLTSQPDTVAMVLGNTTFAMGGLVGGVIFGSTTLATAGTRGVWVGDTDSRAIQLYETGPSPSVVIRWKEARSREVDARRLREFWNRLEEALPPGEQQASREMRDKLVFADSLPAFGSLLAAPSGAVWIGSPIPPERQLLNEPWPEQEWLVVDPRTDKAWRARSPRGLRVLQVGDTFILGVHMNELGVESLRHYPLR